MCGIAGILRGQASEIDLVSEVARMGAAMSRRGPDDEGYLLASADGSAPMICFGRETTTASRESHFPFSPEHDIAKCEGNFQIALAHRRLAIRDLTPSGFQPLCTPDGRYWMVFNGEIYNDGELREQLSTDEEPFYGSSDTEVLLRGYARWGRDVLGKLNGMFALAIWDVEKGSLFLARDRIGIKPLHYVRRGGDLLFASDVKTLLASTRVPFAPDTEGLYHALSFGIAPRPLTSFRNVRALEAGTWMEIESGGSENSGTYWTLPYNIQQRGMDEGQAVEELDALLVRSVRRRLVSDTEVACFMSGGIDSTAVTAIASREQPGITAFTLAFDGAPQDELSSAKETAEKYPVRHIVQRYAPDDALKFVREMVLCYEEPFYSLSPNFLIAQLVASHGIKVVLGGLGPDELFGGYSKYRRLAPTDLLSREGLADFGRKLLGKGPRSSQAVPEYYYKVAAIYRDEEKRRMLGLGPSYDSLGTLTEFYLPDRPITDPVEIMNHLDLRHLIGNHHVYRVDQFTMFHSLEGRFPYLDHEIMEFSKRVPSHLKVRTRSLKHIMRRVASKYVPSSCLEMEKLGFSLPMKQWIMGPLRSFCEETIDSLRKRNFLNGSVLNAELANVQNGQFRAGRVWMLVGLELWFQAFEA